MKGRKTKDQALEHTGAFVFRSERLMPGDILLCNNPDSLAASAIRLVTRGRFSHAAIYTRDSLFIEAHDRGVHEFSIDSLALSDRRNIEILRLKRAAGGATKARRAAEAAGWLQTQPYGTFSALNSILPGDFGDTEGYAFCSFLVALAYEVAEAPLTSKKPRKTTPADIEKSQHLRPITRSILRPVDLGADARLIDGGRDFKGAGPEYGVRLYEVARMAAAYLTGRGRKTTASYPEVQLTFCRSVNEPWFDELDALLHGLVTELCLPILDQLDEASEQARVGPDKILEKLGTRDRATFLLDLELIERRLAVASSLAEDRRRSVTVLRDLPKPLGGTKTVALWRSIDARVASAHNTNAIYLARDLGLYRKHGLEKGWLASLLNDPAENPWSSAD